jgi:hypothetical protein
MPYPIVGMHFRPPAKSLIIGWVGASDERE